MFGVGLYKVTNRMMILLLSVTFDLIISFYDISMWLIKKKPPTRLTAAKRRNNEWIGKFYYLAFAGENDMLTLRNLKLNVDLNNSLCILIIFMENHVRFPLLR